MLNLFNYATFMRRCLCVATLTMVLAMAANAYTLVMRDGRRVEIPDSFSVTATALTYEYAPGLSVTVFLNNVDVAATEGANGEPDGSLRQRAVKSNIPAETAAPRRTITNQDLAPYKRTREAYEATENKRRAAAGLPSLETERNKRAEERLRQADEVAKINAQDQQNEAYWRNRAARLREEAAALDAQINSLSARLNETYDSRNNYQTYGVVLAPAYGYTNQPNLSLTEVRPGLPYNWGPGFNNLNPATQVNPSVDLNYNAQVFRQAANQRRPRYGYGYNSTYLVNGSSNSGSYETERLRARLAELQAERAALNARWSTLQEDARRAGVQAGWLRD